VAQLKLGVLDQSPVRAGGTARDALAETVRLAQAAERLGYSRYWLAEHHGTDGFAGSAPEVLIARVAAATETIRVGSGGVMLAHYSPLKVAENFRLLETMFPGRIDLGIGRAPGSDQVTAAALAYGNPVGIEYFATRIADLAAFLRGERPVTEAFAQVRATPAPDGPPEMWVLGSSDQSAIYAAHFGMGFSFAHFISPHGGDAVMRHYRDSFQPSVWAPAPIGNIGVFVVCAPTDEEAERLAASRDLWRLRLQLGRHGPYPTVEEALAYQYSPHERAIVEANRANRIAGSPAKVRAQLEALAQAYMIEEIVVLTIVHDPALCLRSYELLAREFGLEGARAAA